MNSKRLLLSTFCVAALSGAYLFGNDQEGYRVARVAGNVSHLVGGRGGNIGVQAGKSGILVIDDQFLDLAPEIEKAIASIQKGTPRFLVNTHFHGDHTGGNPHFGEQSVIIAHANVRVRLAGDDNPEVALPVVTYDDGLSLHFNGEEIRLIHIPNAHTDGDTVVWFTGSKVVHMGDLYFDIGYPFIDVASGGSPRGMIAGLDKILATVPDDTKLIPGHGVVTGTAELRVYRNMIATITDRVEALEKEGFSIDEMLEAEVTADFDERWVWGFIDARRMVESVVNGLE